MTKSLKRKNKELHDGESKSAHLVIPDPNDTTKNKLYLCAPYENYIIKKIDYTFLKSGDIRPIITNSDILKTINEIFGPDASKKIKFNPRLKFVEYDCNTEEDSTRTMFDEGVISFQIYPFSRSLYIMHLYKCGD